jgi:hypothetical protein
LGDRRLIFKLHPNENTARATREIRKWAPEALVFATGSAEQLIANCDVFITRYSSTVFVALALGKDVRCDLNVEELQRLVPHQNGQAAQNIASVCREILGLPPSCEPVSSTASHSAESKQASAVGLL